MSTRRGSTLARLPLARGDLAAGELTPSNNQGRYAMPLWNKQVESMPWEALRALQLQRLKAVVARAARQSPFYRRRFADSGVEPGSIRSLDDIAALPFTTKDDLRDQYPWAMCAVPMKDVIRIHASSGT